MAGQTPKPRSFASSKNTIPGGKNSPPRRSTSSLENSGNRWSPRLFSMRGRTAWKPRKPTPSLPPSACRSRRTRDERNPPPAETPVLRQGRRLVSRAFPEGRRRRLPLRRSHDSDSSRTPERSRVGAHVPRISRVNPHGKTREKLAKPDGNGAGFGGRKGCGNEAGGGAESR